MTGTIAAGPASLREPVLEAAERSTEKRAETVGALARYLAWHGIETETRLFETGSLSAGEAILAETGHRGADLLVIGGYGHSPMQERILGGVTPHVLDRAEIPLFMAH